jgi:WD40 repeat protein
MKIYFLLASILCISPIFGAAESMKIIATTAPVSSEITRLKHVLPIQPLQQLVTEYLNDYDDFQALRTDEVGEGFTDSFLKTIIFFTNTQFITISNQKLKLWELNHKNIFTLTYIFNIKEKITRAQFVKDKKIFILSSNNEVQIWIFNEQKYILSQILKYPIESEYCIKTITISQDGNYLMIAVLANSNTEITIWKFENNYYKHIQDLPLSHHNTTQLAITSNGTYLAEAFLSTGLEMQKNFRLWKLENNTYKAMASEKIHDLKNLLFSPNDQYLALRTATAIEIRTLINHEYVFLQKINTEELLFNELYTLNFSSDSQFLVAVYNNRISNIWELKNGTYILKDSFKKISGIRHSASFSPHNIYLAIQTDDTKIDILKNQKLELELEAAQPKAQEIFKLDDIDPAKVIQIDIPTKFPQRAAGRGYFSYRQQSLGYEFSELHRY